MLPYKGIAFVSLLTLFLGIGFDLLAPWLLKQTFDVGIATGSLSIIAMYTLLLLVGQFAKSGGSYLQGYTQELVAQKVVFDMRRQLYDHLQRLSFGYYDKAQTGQIMSRMTGDIEAVKNFVAFGAMSLIAGILTFVGTIAIMMWLQWKVTLISMATVPLLALAVWQFSKKVGPAWSDIREQMGRLTTTLQENISGIRVVKAFAQEAVEKKKFGDRNGQNLDSNMTRARIEASAFPVMGFYGGVIFLFMIWLGGIYVVKGEMTMGTLIAFQWYAWGIIWPLNMLGWLVNIMQQALKAAPRVFEIIDTPIDIVSPADGGMDPSSIRGQVTFDRVSFSFPSGEEKENRPVLSDISLQVEPGEAIAVLGATGSGKSSLINLLPRFYDVTAGAVLIDGVDVREFGLTELRRKIGIVPQETFLFSATIRENIAYGKPDASMEQIERAARKAQIHDFILTLPKGYETLVGERGVGLSGGQRQRVALARAILTDPPVLVLDEATASVDTATESAIHEALHEVMEGRTTFIVAQRLSSVQRADRIIVLDNGCIAEQGTHKELFERGGFYRKLYQMQQTAAPGAELPSESELPAASGGRSRL